MPFLPLGVMLLLFSAYVRTPFVVNGQVRVFRLTGDRAARRRAQLRRLSKVCLVLGVISTLVGVVVLLAK